MVFPHMRDIVAEQRKKIYNCFKSLMERDDKDSFQHLLRHHCSVDIKDFMVTGSGLFMYLEDGTYFKIPFSVQHFERDQYEIVSVNRHED